LGAAPTLAQILLMEQGGAATGVRRKSFPPELLAGILPERLKRTGTTIPPV